MGAMLLNLSANVLGLGNAATPFGLKAMRELETLNPRPGVATNAMALFLAINTAGVAVLPLGVIAVRASLGSDDAAAIIAPSLLATFTGTLVAIAAAKALERLPWFAPERAVLPAADAGLAAGLSAGIPNPAESHELPPAPPLDRTRAFLALGFALLLAAALVRFVTDPADGGGFERVRDVLNGWLLPALMAGIALVGFSRRVPVYDAFVGGAREGFEIAVAIIPFLLAILVGVAMFRASGALDALTDFVSPVTSLVGFPAEALPMALIRPLSGSGAMGVMTETMQAYGPDSFVGYLVSVINGSTETTFYVLALYFGSVGVRATRHTVAACVAADVAGIGGAFVFSRIFF
jgi:spore maturation protein SpmB